LVIELLEKQRRDAGVPLIVVPATAPGRMGKLSPRYAVKLLRVHQQRGDAKEPPHLNAQKQHRATLESRHDAREKPGCGCLGVLLIPLQRVQEIPAVEGAAVLAARDGRDTLEKHLVQSPSRASRWPRKESVLRHRRYRVVHSQQNRSLVYVHLNLALPLLTIVQPSTRR
jgi:hypothetical protein